MRIWDVSAAVGMLFCVLAAIAASTSLVSPYRTTTSDRQALLGLTFAAVGLVLGAITLLL